MDKSVTVLIVDDEMPARRKVRSFLKSENYIAEILEAESAAEAVSAIEGHRLDLIFLDIQMPDGDGFDVIRSVGIDRMPPVIFVTAYDRYALAAFDVEAVDYLLKPFDRKRFRRALNRALDRIRVQSPGIEDLQRLMDAVDRFSPRMKRMLVREGNRHFFVKTQAIHYLVSEDQYVRLFTDTENYLIRESLTRLESKLDPCAFTRIHRSSIVQIDRIGEIQPGSHGDFTVLMKDGTRLKGSRRYRDRLLS